MTKSLRPPSPTQWPCEPLWHGAARDILAAIDRCLVYSAYLDSAEIGPVAYDAVLRNLAVIGEAVKSVPVDFKEHRPSVPWASIAGLRNIVVHE